MHLYKDLIASITRNSVAKTCHGQFIYIVLCRTFFLQAETEDICISDTCSVCLILKYFVDLSYVVFMLALVPTTTSYYCTLDATGCV